MECNESLTVKQLKETCKERGIRGYSRLRKADLVDKCCDDTGKELQQTVEMSNTEGGSSIQPDDVTDVIEIESWKRQGLPPEREVLECKKEGDEVKINYAPFYYPEDYRYGKRNKIIIEVRDGIIVGRTKNKWVGKCNEMIDHVNKVSGRTYNIKEDIKQKGFTWDRKNKLWTRIVNIHPDDSKPLDAWNVANLSFNDDSCDDIKSNTFVPRLESSPTLEESCDSIVSKIHDNNLGNWLIYNKGKCQLLNNQTGWFINPRYSNLTYTIKVNRSLNHSDSKFENMWKPYFSSDGEFDTFEKVCECNGKKTLDVFAKELRSINS